MYNPDSYSDYNLEWIELYNEKDSPINLKNWSINDNKISEDLIIEPKENLIVCRELFDSSSEKDSFEEVFGNGSGIWGDSSDENSKLIELPISLSNSGDSIIISNSDNPNLAEIIYSPDNGADGNDKTLEVYANLKIRESLEEMGTPGTKLYKAKIIFSKEDVQKNIEVYNNSNLLYEYTTSDLKSYIYHLNLNTEYQLKIKAEGYKSYSSKLVIMDDSKVINIELDKLESFNIFLTFKNSSNEILNNVEVYIKANENKLILSSEDKLELRKGIYSIYFSKKDYLTVYRKIEVYKDKDIKIEFPDLNSIKINELDYLSESTDIEWIELYNTTDKNISLKDVTIQDRNLIENNENIKMNRSIILGDGDFIILTSNKEKFENNFISDSRIYEIDNLFSMNDSSEVICIKKDKKIIDRLKYENGILNNQSTSLERINPNYKSKEFNFYPSFEKTPLKENSVKNLINNDMEVLISEVYPFSNNEYIEVYIKETGNSKGILLNIFEITDFDKSFKIDSAEIFDENEVIVFENKLSLNDYGDQVILNSLSSKFQYTDQFFYRKKYTNYNSEKSDFEKIQSSNIYKYDEKDYTKSFSFNLYNWRFNSTTKGYIDMTSKNIEDNISIKEKLLKGEKIAISYNYNSKKEIIFKIYDTGGVQKLQKKFYLEGKGRKTISFIDQKGRYIYFLKIREGKKKKIKRGSLIVY